MQPAKLRNVQVYYITQLNYLVIITLIKNSILLMLLRIFPLLWFRRCAFSLIAFCLLFGVVNVVVTAFQCIPVSKAWYISQTGKCLDQGSLFASQAIISLLTEILIVFLPVPAVWGLQMPLRQRILVIGFFIIGLV